MTNIVGPLWYHMNVPSGIQSTGSKGRLVRTLSSIYPLSHHGWIQDKFVRVNFFSKLPVLLQSHLPLACVQDQPKTSVNSFDSETSLINFNNQVDYFQ